MGIGDVLGRRAGDPHLLLSRDAHLVDEVPLAVRGEVEDLGGAVVVAVADGEDRSFRAIGVVPVLEGTVLDGRASLQLDGHEDVPATVVKDDRRILLGVTAIDVTRLGFDERAGVFPLPGNQGVVVCGRNQRSDEQNRERHQESSGRAAGRSHRVCSCEASRRCRGDRCRGCVACGSPGCIFSDAWRS